ncbi:MAG: DUF1549 domain-containing protein [Verrucomicrobiota bacterium]
MNHKHHLSGAVVCGSLLFGFLPFATKAETSPTVLVDKLGRTVEVSEAKILGDQLQFSRIADGKSFLMPLDRLADKTVIQLMSTHETAVDFPNDIRPIFEARCISCHGAERQKGGYRMDTRDWALKGAHDEPGLLPGNAKESLLFQLVTLHAEDEDRMPAKGEPLTIRQKILLKRWIDDGASWSGPPLTEKRADVVQLVESAPKGSKEALLKDELLHVQHSRRVDAFIAGFQKELRLPPGRIVEDDVFLRRVYLDITGRIPTLAEYETFMASTDPNKRHDLVDELLDSPGFVEHTFNQWRRALRIQSKTFKITTESYTQWLRRAIANNMPYDEFVHRMVGSEGSIYDPEHAAVGYFARDRGMDADRMANTVELFLGTSITCAQCHDHPFDRWTQMDFFKLLAFNNGTMVSPGGSSEAAAAVERARKSDSEVGAKIQSVYDHYGRLSTGVFGGGAGVVRLPADYKYDDGDPGELVKAGVPFGPEVDIDYDKAFEVSGSTAGSKASKKYNKSGLKDVGSRAYFADWLTSPENPMFTRAIVNRLWDRVFGAPLVGELLNLSLEDMGQIPQLTAYLVRLMEVAEYDQKLFLKILYKTDLYQRESVDLTKSGKWTMAGPVPERLSAEQLWDSLLAVRAGNPDAHILSGTLVSGNVVFLEMNPREKDERYEFATDLRPLQEKADPALVEELTTRTVRSSFGTRASFKEQGVGEGVGTFLHTFGRGSREVIDESVREATIPQALAMMNDLRLTPLEEGKGSSELFSRLASGRGRLEELNRETITWIYHGVLTRDPKPNELSLARSLPEDTGASDLLWILANSTEFKIKR